MSIRKRGCLKKPPLATCSETWTEEEVQNLLRSICAYGHCNYKKILSSLPEKNKGQVKNFLRRLTRIAKSGRGNPPEQIFNINNWIKAIELGNSPNDSSLNGGPLELAIILKLLSLDGVLENHPLPAEANGVDFGACYRVLYQAILGHPIQPVNRETLEVLFDCFFDLIHTVDGNQKIINDLDKKLNKNCPTEDPLMSLYSKSIIKNSDMEDCTPLVTKADVKNNDGNTQSRAIKTYTRKSRSGILNNEVKEIPGKNNSVIDPKQVSVIVESLPTNPLTVSCSLQISLNLPKRMEPVLLKDEEKEVFEDSTYNPLKLPVEWLKNSSLVVAPNKKAKKKIIGEKMIIDNTEIMFSNKN